MLTWSTECHHLAIPDGEKKVPQVGSISGHDKVLEQRVQRRQMREAQPRNEDADDSATKQHESPGPDRDVEPDVASSQTPRKRRQKSSYTVTK